MVKGDPRMTALHCHPKDTLSPRPPLPSGHLLSLRTDAPENLAWILVRTLTVFLSLPENGGWALWAQKRGAQSSPCPLTTPPLHVQHLVHTPVPPGTPNARGGEPCSPGLTSDLAHDFPRRGLISSQRSGGETAPPDCSACSPCPPHHPQPWSL